MKKPASLALLVFGSFTLFHVGSIIEEIVRWTDHLAGLVNGLVMAIPMSLVWAISALPWCVAVHYIYRWRGWSRFRCTVALLPSILLLLASLAGLAMSPRGPHDRFQRFAKTPIPASARDIVYHLEGGGFADYEDVYYFSCSQADSEALIQALNVELLGGSEVDLYASFKLPPGAPDFHTWPDRRIYQRYDKERGWFYRIVTDSTATKVYVCLSCI